LELAQAIQQSKEGILPPLNLGFQEQPTTGSKSIPEYDIFTRGLRDHGQESLVFLG
jgi:hypothetical protein